MPTRKTSPKATTRTHSHKDGSVWAKGRTLDGVPTGYWEWYRKDGVRMRSGTFEAGRQVGEWTTYDKRGKVYKVTRMKAPTAPGKSTARAATSKRPVAKSGPRGREDGNVSAWSKDRSATHRAICDALRPLIDASLPDASSRVWHGSPVWFLGENPVVGYSVKSRGVSLLFWNGQAFKEPELKPVGKYGAAEAVFRDVSELDTKVIRRWLKQAGAKVFDSVALFRKLREAR